MFECRLEPGVEGSQNSSSRSFKKFQSVVFIIRVLIGGLFGYILAWGIGGEKFPRKREERRGREKKELEE